MTSSIYDSEEVILKRVFAILSKSHAGFDLVAVLMSYSKLDSYIKSNQRCMPSFGKDLHKQREEDEHRDRNGSLALFVLDMAGNRHGPGPGSPGNWARSDPNTAPPRAVPGFAFGCPRLGRA